MASRVQQDTFIDDSDETWYAPSIARSLVIPSRGAPVLMTLSPLCVEEFDLSDRNFRPCPCGYQVRRSPYMNHINPLQLRATSPRIVQ